MFRHFFKLQWKSFIRSASFRTNLAFKILMFLAGLYFIAIFLGLGVAAFYIMEESGIADPLLFVNGYLIYYLLIDLYMRYMLQKMPVMNIRPLLYLPFRKSQVVYFSLGKTLTSFFNWAHAFFFVPFSIVLLKEGYSTAGIISWHLAVFAFFYCNNFINILINNRERIFYGLLALLAIFGGMQYYGLFDVTLYSQNIFQAFYVNPAISVAPWIVLLALAVFAFLYFKKRLYLDGGLAMRQEVARTEEFSWLNRLGSLGTFLKNDIRLIKRNKRSRTTVVMSVLFLFYGLLFFAEGIDSYEHPVWKIFAGIFVTGGFLFSFGQFVPSWDSSYYPLLMSQNIQYREYLNSKWYLVIIATAISAVLASFYLYFGWDAYLAILVGAIYNIGVNSHLVLWGGAYIKSPIDLSSNRNILGDKQAFNMKTMLLLLPKLLLPLGIYALGHYLINPAAGYLFVAATGLCGLAFKNQVFRLIENIYKKEKHRTLKAYAEKSQ